MPGPNLSDVLLHICFPCVLSWCFSCFVFLFLRHRICNPSALRVCHCQVRFLHTRALAYKLLSLICTANYSILYISEDPLARVRKTERAKIDSNGFFSVRGNAECCNSVVGDQKVQIWSDNWIWLHALISTGIKKTKQNTQACDTCSILQGNLTS